MSAKRARAAHLDEPSCADLVLGLLEAREREKVLDHAAECPDCEARLKAHAGAAARAEAELRVGLGQPITGSGAQGRVVRMRPPWRAPRILGLVAAAVLVLSIGLPWLARRGPVDRDVARWLPVSGELIRNREIEEADPRLAAGLAAYRARDLAAADRELSAARASGGAERLRQLCLAHVKLERGDARGSLALLRGVEWRMVPEPWRREGVALLVRALRENGERESADSLERELARLGPATPLMP
jgi:hypothetical protein